MDKVEAKVIDCYEFDLTLNDGTRYKIVCGRSEIDKLIDFIGEDNICYVDEM